MSPPQVGRTPRRLSGCQEPVLVQVLRVALVYQHQTGASLFIAEQGDGT